MKEGKRQEGEREEETARRANIELTGSLIRRISRSMIHIPIIKSSTRHHLRAALISLPAPPVPIPRHVLRRYKREHTCAR